MLNIQEFGAGVTIPVPVADGGTGSTSAADARTALGAAAASHTHAIADVTSLQAGLDAKAAASHTHAQSDVTGLVAALAGKASSSHTHVLADITDYTASFIPNAFLLKRASTGLWTAYGITTTAQAAYDAAKTAATSGDTIAIGPGTYNISNLLKNGVTLEFAAGAKVVQTSGSTNIFDDSGLGAIVCRILGNGYFDQQVANKKVLNIANGSTIMFEADVIMGSGSGTSGVYQDGFGSELHVDVNVLSGHASGYAAYCGATCIQDIECLLLGYEAISASGDQNVRLSGSSSVQSLSAVRCSNLGSIYAAGTSQQVVELGLIRTATNGTIECTTARQTVNYTATTTAAAGIASITLSGSGRQFIQCDMLDITGAGIICSSTGKQYVEADAIIGTNASNPVLSITGAGEQIVESNLISTNRGGQYAITGSAGTQRMKVTRVENTGTNGVPANLGGQKLILEGGCTFVAEAGASVTINASSARDLYLYGIAVANKPLDADITVLVGGVNGGTPSNSYVVDANVT